MAVFDITGKSTAESAQLVEDAAALSQFSYHNFSQGLWSGYYDHGFKLGLPATLIRAVVGNSDAEGIIPYLPWTPNSEAQAEQDLNNAGWQVITPEQLGYEGRTDKLGTYHGEKFGYLSAQADVVGKYNEDGQLQQIGVAFRGTGGPRETAIIDTALDVLHDLDFASFLAILGRTNQWQDYSVSAFGDLLESVASFAQKNGLEGDDVLITGHSLGGGAVNGLATHRDDFAGGFYKDANFIGFASPVESDGVLNIGSENDPVYGLDLDPSNLLSGLFPNGHFSHPDTFEHGTSGLVQFNDFYADGITPQSLFNLFSWISHDMPGYSTMIPRIVNSAFYEQTNLDSTIVVSNLSDPARDRYWVEDLNQRHQERHGSSFIIGSDKDDLIQGGSGNNYLEGLGGNDTFRIGDGYNIIAGGDGTNVLDVQRGLDDLSVAYHEGTLYTQNPYGGITIARDIDTLRSNERSFLFHRDRDYQVSEQGLDDGHGKHVDYAQSQSVSGEGDDNLLYIDNGDQWGFGGAGDDIIFASESGGTTIIGGEGNDTLYSQAGGNTFLFSENFGQDTLYGFTGDDKLVFLNTTGSNDGDPLSHLQFSDEGLDLTFGDNSVSLVGITADDFSQDQLITA
ncbi:hypothetical protein R84981_002541 [Carnimonas sp. R-84981]|uniref:polyurethane esterase n=1 Tax=Carnimonas bestiolae TaxID=3402172 RepID=UPI003EDBEB4F